MPLPVLDDAFPKGGEVGRIFWGLFAIAVGAAGLHPALAQRHYRVTATAETSRVRIGLFAVLALVPPAIWGVELSRRKSQPAEILSFIVPLVASVIFLWLLVAKLGTIAKVAEQRASQLSAAVSEQRELQRQLAHRAMHDPLTGLFNRLVLADRMGWVLNRNHDVGRHALLLLDLDGFKEINDTLGHPVGDDLLVAVSHRLTRVAPAKATVARLGGDEFAVLLEDTEQDEAVRQGEAFVREVRRRYFIAGDELLLTTSVGVLTTDAYRTAPSPEEALRDADLALYAAKGAGKNRVFVFHPDLRAAHLHHTRMNAGIREAWAKGEFVLHYQPIVDLETQSVVTVVALLRWKQGGQRLLLPADFLPIAEETGLILPIGAWALRQACRDARDWYHRASGLRRGQRFGPATGRYRLRGRDPLRFAGGGPAGSRSHP